jgi:nucleoside-diphosphate-sugar epimerase
MSIKNKRIFLTGGAGFIGVALARLLADENEIIIYDNLHRNGLTRSGLLDHKNVRLVTGNILDLESLKTAMTDCQIVIHLAAIAGVDTVLEDVSRTLTVNVIGTHNVLEAARSLHALERFVDFSTSEVFGTHAYNVDELHQTSQGSIGEARWSYAVSKLVGEHFCHAYFKKHGMPTVSIRPFNVYGPGQVGDGAVRSFVLNAIKNENLVIYGDGSQIRAWCYIDDMVNGVLLAMTKPEAIGQSFNIGNPRSTITIYNLALTIANMNGSSSRIVFKPINYTDIEIRVPNIEKARKLLGFEPKVELEDGVLRTINWYKEHLL